MCNNKVKLALSLLWGIPVFLFSQTCPLSISGRVLDLGTGLPLEFVNVLVKETGKGEVTDSKGAFRLEAVCPGDYHIVFSHIGCSTREIYVPLEKDTVLEVSMEHSAKLLEGVVVAGKQAPVSTQQAQGIGKDDIIEHISQNLANMLESISGVSALKNGNGIAKPVVHGLYGNRLTILNNGITQSGQQWGNDHSPEIDPLVANKISVIKGVAALEYMGSNLGSVILVEPDKIAEEPHLHGQASYFFESNGLGNGINLQLQQYQPHLAWRVNGTLKKSGDRQSADYYLRNTGSEEANLALQLEKSYSGKLFTDLYFSTFNAELGVLRGSHIGNLTDLESALTREIPFFTEDEFSYAIEAPKQKVGHQLLKLHAKYLADTKQWLDLTLAGQFNNRKEYDVRRSGRSEIPALSLQQFSYSLEGRYHKLFGNGFKLNAGVQSNFIDNTNNPETGILPLIPDYTALESGVFAVFTGNRGKSFFELGARYDNVFQQVATITQTTPREIVRYNNFFHNFSGSAGWKYSPASSFSISLNTGYATRNPAINELYSFGLHQGVSGIEEGNLHLHPEQSFNSSVGVNFQTKDRFSLESLVYLQFINNYIYLDPSDEIRLTIRGAFPVFNYAQTDARILGWDFSGHFQISRILKTKLVWSLIDGNDFSNKIPLINMPSNSLYGSLTFSFPGSINLGRSQLRKLEIEAAGRQVFKQKNLLPGQDFVPAPEGYGLLGLTLSGEIQLHKTQLLLSVKGENLLNEAYRDYLNRQRYFANDLGRNIIFSANLKF